MTLLQVGSLTRLDDDRDFNFTPKPLVVNTKKVSKKRHGSRKRNIVEVLVTHSRLPPYKVMSSIPEEETQYSRMYIPRGQ